MAFTLRVLAALVSGLLLGIGISTSHAAWLHRIPPLVEPLGVVFISGIRMAVIPLVVSSLVVGVASMREARAVGVLAARSFALFLALLAAAAVFSAACAIPLVRQLRVDPAVADSLRAGLSPAIQGGQASSFSGFLTDLVPVNVFKAAADGAILPLIVFALAFGLALIRVEAGRRAAVLRFFQGVADAMVGVVSFVLRLTPFGVFALAVPLGARGGVAAAGALAYYVALASAVSVAFMAVVLLPAAILIGRVPPLRFLRACAPAQAIAFTSRSSLAALPAAMEGAKEGLGLPGETVSFLLPLAASLFKPGGTIAQVVGVLFLARLYGVNLQPAEVGTVLVTSVLTTLTIPGVPAGALLVMAPVLASVAIPAEGLGVLIAVDAIPDMFRTTANVTGWLAAASLLGRAEAGGPGGPAAPELPGGDAPS